MYRSLLYFQVGVEYPGRGYTLSPDTLPPDTLTPQEGTWDQRYPTPPKGHGTRGPGRDLGPVIPYPPLVYRMTHTCENITFPQLRWRAVNITHPILFPAIVPVPSNVKTTLYLITNLSTDRAHTGSVVLPRLMRAQVLLQMVHSMECFIRTNRTQETFTHVRSVM